MASILAQVTDTLQLPLDSLSAIRKEDLFILRSLEEKIAASEYRSNTLWMLFATGLVFIMNLGFACLETGLTRSKNATNVLFKSTVIPVIVLLTFSAWAFHFMFPGNFNYLPGGASSISGFGIHSPQETGLNYGNGNYSFWTFFLFHCMLASVATNIISGAVAERIKLTAFIIFAFVFAGFIYPIISGWFYGGSWVNQLFIPSFHDFAGSSLIHSVGGYAALAGAALVGPRIGKYAEERIMPIMGHNIPIAGIGLFILWFGWIGLIGGCVLSSEPDKLSYVIVITLLASAAGCMGAFVISFMINRTHDITMLMNGTLSGLVAISASADIMPPLEAFVIGLIAGLLVVFSVLIFDKLKIDDPVGAISVHLMCGIWGTLAVGIFGPLANRDQFVSQLIGCATIGIAVTSTSFLIFFLLKKTVGLRVSSKKELEGLDINEHGMKAYYFDGENN